MLTKYETVLLLQALNAQTKEEKILRLQDLLTTEVNLFYVWYDRLPDRTVYAEQGDQNRNWSKLTIGAMLKKHEGSLNENEQEALCVVLNAWIEELIQEEAGE